MTGWRLWAALLGAGALAGSGHVLPAAPLAFQAFGPPLLVLGLVLGLALIGSVRGRTAAWRGWLFGLGYFAAGMHWIVEPFLVDPITVWMAPFGLIFMAGGLALFWGGAALAAGALTRGATPVSLAVALALAEWLRGWVLTGLPWNSPAQVWVSPGLGVVQALAYIGPWGLTLATLLVAALLTGLWNGRQGTQGGARLATGAAVIAALLAVNAAGGLIAGGAQPVPPERPIVRPIVRLVTPHAPQALKWDPAHASGFFQDQLAATALRPLPDLVVWPEAAVADFFFATETEVVKTSTLAAVESASGGVPVLLGTQVQAHTGLWHNAAVLIDGAGETGQWHAKVRLVPFGEYMPFPAFWRWTGITGLADRADGGWSPGAARTLIEIEGIGRVQVLICYEGIFPQDIARGAERPDALVILTNDAWFGEAAGPAQHFAQAQMRAIEQGLPVIRVANRGVSAVIDPAGRTVARLPVGEATSLDAALPVPRPATLYARSGDWPFLATILALGVMLFLRRKVD